MPDSMTPHDLLNFPAIADAVPGNPNPGNWEEAEWQCLQFPEIYLRKCRELNEAQQGLTEALDHGERQIGFVIRNLLDAIENCRETAPEEVPPPDAVAAAVPEPAVEGEVSPSADGGDPPGGSPGALDSVRRSLEYVLEELGVRRVELMDTTYGGVVVNGRQIADPFEVVSSTQAGKASERKVTCVLGDLWVDCNGRVVKKGLVIC